MKKKEVQLSNEFKIQTIKSIFALFSFAISYLILLSMAISLTGLCIMWGISIIMIKPTVSLIILGVGVASFGVLILIFLLKFMFQSHKVDRSHLIEITEAQEPNLFQLIREIVLEVGTNFPKKVYLSTDVNASVFYDSSFWSMFLPIKKNLQIGLGLVNTVSKEELKAILSHEFGHFSQRTMKVGSYVYNVNQIIFNMLYDNQSYENLVQKWGDVSSYFSIVGALALKINQGIQWLLRKLYELVNKSYMGLSREMEFHADEIAASVTGYEPLKKSLLRIALADRSFSNVLDYYNSKISDNIKSESIYRDQSSVLYFLAEENNLPITNKLPDISLEEQSKFDKSKLIIKDQWASHPSTEDRIRRLEKTGFVSEKTSDFPANDLFTDILGLQKKLTEKMFEGIKYSARVKTISSDEFITQYKQEVLLNSFSRIYNGYYDNKNPTFFELSACQATDKKISLDELYSDEKVDLVYSALALQSDMEALKSIHDHTFAIKTFDYDGIRYKRKNASGLIEKLALELELTNEKIKQNDMQIFTYFKRVEKEQQKPAQLERMYTDFFSFDKIFDEKYELYTELLNDLQFLNVTTPYEEIKRNFSKISPKEELLKKEMLLLMADPIFTDEITKEIKKNIEEYTSRQWNYFGGDAYFDDKIDMLYTALNNFAFMLSRKYFLMKRSLLRYQEDLAKN